MNRATSEKCGEQLLFPAKFWHGAAMRKSKTFSRSMTGVCWRHETAARGLARGLQAVAWAAAVTGLTVVPERGTAAEPGERRPVLAVEPEWMEVKKWDDSNGDTGDPFWADDGTLYTFMCDGRGFGKGPQMNLNFNRLEGGGDWFSLTGIPVHPMDDYGKANQKEADNATWKICGQECIDGVFYAFVARNVYGKDNKGDPLMRQSSFHASLIKSTDRGRTWTRSAAENLRAPMWPGTRFGAPSFIHFGQDGGAVSKDAADRFVYAVSNNGFWNGGDDFVLGRVERAKLARLQASDWEYRAGEDQWVKDPGAAVPVLRRPGKLGWTSPCYLPSLERYLLVSWHLTPTLKKWFEPGEVVYDFHEAPHPWGPWTFVSSFSDRVIVGGHMYGPNLCTKFQKAGKDGEVKVLMFTSGCPFEDVPAGLYKLWCVPLTVRTTAAALARVVNDDDARLVFHGEWKAYRRPERRYHGGDIHATQREGDSVEFEFEGSGIEVLSERFADLGPCEVFLDGTSRGVVRPALERFPRIVQVPVYRSGPLPPGKHRLRIVNRGNQWLVLDALRVYGGS